MTRAVIEYAIEAARAKTTSNLNLVTAQTDTLRAIEADCRDYYFSHNFDVAMDIIKGLAGSKALQDYISKAHRAYREQTETAWIATLEHQGWPAADAEIVVAMTASMVRGLAIRAMIKPDTEQYQRLLAKWHEMVEQTFPYARQR